MKKTICLFILIILFYMVIGNVVANNNLIPEDAIRIRIIANSNSNYDQEIKNKVKVEVEKNIYEMLKNTKSVEDAREEIKNNVSSIDNQVETVLKKEKYLLPYKVNFGYNYFPEKEYKGITYKEGYYESLVITLGEGLGDNWWCVLFPPLCMIEAEESTDIEYTTMVKTIVDKYF